MISEEDSLNQKEKRIFKLQTMLNDTKKQIVRKVMRMSQDITSHSMFVNNAERQRKNRKILNSRARKTTNFVKIASESFFTLMCNSETLALTTQIDVIEKVEKFKKNVTNACQKMMHNADEEGEGDRTEKQSPSQEKVEDNEQNDEEGQKKSNRIRSISRSRSKNYKTSNEATLSMMEWLLENFQNPYPSHEQKIKMAKEGNISINKVNNWFINARERTVKAYFSRDV